VSLPEYELSWNVSETIDRKKLAMARAPALALLLTLGGSALADTLRVPTREFATIQRAIDFAKDDDTVLVTPGEYVITEAIDSNRIHDPDDPKSPPLKNILVRSAQGADATVIRLSATTTARERTSVVIFEKGESEASVLEGFTVTGGSQPLRDERLIDGGALMLSRSSPIVRNCIISGNSGRGVHCLSNSSATLTNCTISGNSGGVFCGDSSLTLISCTISGNSASDDGGGVFCFRSSTTLTRCRISRNRGGQGRRGVLLGVPGDPDQLQDLGELGDDGRGDTLQRSLLADADELHDRGELGGERRRGVLRLRLLADADELCRLGQRS